MRRGTALAMVTPPIMTNRPHNELGTAAELGELIGISARAVSDLGKRGVAVRAGPGRWRLQESVRRYCDGLRHRGGGEAVRTTTTVERGRLAKEQADSFALKNARLRGSLVEREAVQREWSAILTLVRSRVLAVPSRWSSSPELAASARVSWPCFTRRAM